MKNQLVLMAVALLCIGLSAKAQGIAWHDPQEAGFVVLEGQAFPQESHGCYQRFPDSRKDLVPSWVWGNALHSAGISLRFRTKSATVKVKYATRSTNYSMPHMPFTGVSGVDLYELGADGCSHYCAPRSVFGLVEKDTLRYEYVKLRHQFGDVYELYLPLYNQVSWMQIGVPEGEDFAFLQPRTEKPILVYGTSIAHGGCASRPAMSWPSIVKRALDVPFLNWGFSGSGRLDSTMFVQMKQVDAMLYIIDCMPNMDGMKDQIYPRLLQGIRMLRKECQTPILIVEHDGYCNKETGEDALRFLGCNVEARRAYQTLKKEGVRNLHYMTYEEIGLPEDAQVDGVHASDYGMVCYANAYLKKIRKILKLKVKR